MQDMDMLHRGLDVVDGMLRKLEEGNRIEIADVTMMLKVLRCFADEHGEERTLVSEIENALITKRGMDFLRSSRRLASVLRNRVDKEKSLSSISENSYACLVRLEQKYCPKPVMNRLTQTAR
jgi:hypothetical protein